MTDNPSITCPKCGATSYNPHDIAEQYCGRCNRFHDGIGGLLPKQRPPFIPDTVEPAPGALVMASDDRGQIELLAEQVKAVPDHHLASFMAATHATGLQRQRILEWCSRRFRRKLHLDTFGAWKVIFVRAPKLARAARSGMVTHMLKGRDRVEAHSIGGYSTRELQTIANLAMVCA